MSTAFISSNANRNLSNGNHNMNHQPTQSPNGVQVEDKLEPIAIIGFDTKFPQDANSPENLWQMLMDRRSAMTEIPPDRFNIDAFYHPGESGNGSINIRGGHFIKEDLASFDAPFFSMSVDEASAIDPQQRGLLETTFRALENAGIPMESIAGSNTSVFIGSFVSEYMNMMSRGVSHKRHERYQAVGGHPSLLANRLSWFYDLNGPSMVLDTACSSSLNAVHLACQSLRNGESSMSIVGGGNIFFDPAGMQLMANANFLSPDGICYSFDQRANGYARGEGFGIVVLKRLSKAIEDKDTIRAVIRASGANQDGRTPGLTQPSSAAQETLIRETYRAGGLDMRITRFVEAHGTGTALGDPIEAIALGSAFKAGGQDEPLYIGALKSNIGHLEGASGVAGLIKTVLVLEHGIIPPNIWFEQLNSKIRGADLNLKFPTIPLPWPTKGLRRASVNSFGFGGANAHVVVDDAYNYMRLRQLQGRHVTAMGHMIMDPRRQLSIEGTTNSMRPKLLVWSASDEDALRRMRDVYLEHVKNLSQQQTDEDFLPDVAWTLSERRSRLAWKGFAVAESIGALKANLTTGFQESLRSYRDPLLGFVFTGQGAHWYAMGRELLVYIPFKQSLEDADVILEGLGCPWSVINESTSRLAKPDYSQPICTALQIALVSLLRSWEILPDRVVAHSSGEIAAAYCVGGLSLESALRVAYYRGLVSASLAETDGHGAMLSVGLSEAAVKSYLGEVGGDLVVACINSPSNVTISGHATGIEQLEELLKRDSVFARRLQINVAYHSPHMNRIAGIYSSLIQNLSQGKQPSKSCVMFSSVTCSKILPPDLVHSEYWVRNLISPVRFSQALARITVSKPRKQGRANHDAAGVHVHHLLEIGPHAALRGPIRECLAATSTCSMRTTYSSMLIRGKSAMETALSAAGRLYCLGFPLKVWPINDSPESLMQRSLVTNLPPYPFNRNLKYWCEGRISKNFRFRKFPHHEVLGTPVSDWNPLNARWQNTLRLSSSPWVKDHKVNQTIIYPAAGLLVMAIEGARQLSQSGQPLAYTLREVHMRKALVIPQNDDGVEVQVHLLSLRESASASVRWYDFRIYAYEGDKWSEICEGQIATEYGHDSDGFNEDESIHAHLKEEYQNGAARCLTDMAAETFYRSVQSHGLVFGPCFQTLRNIRFNNFGEATATTKLSALKEHLTDLQSSSYVIHPTSLDAMLQAAIPALTAGLQTKLTTMVPTVIRSLRISGVVESIHSNTDQYPVTDIMDVYAKSETRGLRNAESSFIALPREKPNLRIISGSFQITAASSKDQAISHETDQTSVCSYIDWKPDFDLMSNENINLYCAEIPTSNPTAVSNHQEIFELRDYMCYLVLKRLKNWHLDHNLVKEKPHLLKYLAWAQYQLAQLDGANSAHGKPALNLHSDDEAATLLRLKDILREYSKEGELAVRVADNLERILSGDQDALELMFHDNLLGDFYRENHHGCSGMKAALRWLELFAHKQSDLKILEIGAGTGGATAEILLRLTAAGNNFSRFSEYVFTDISTSFFENARKRFSSFRDRMTFKTLDIGMDPLKQDFEENRYDIVVASNVLHVTPCLLRTIEHARKLLRPCGKLLLFEKTKTTGVFPGFVFGLLPGWWLSTEEYRRLGPLATVDQWNMLLSKCNFSGVDVHIPASETIEPFEFILSTAMDEKHSDSSEVRKTVKIIIDSTSPFQRILASDLIAALNQTTSCETIDLSDASGCDFHDAVCLFLPELEHPVLYGITGNTYAALQYIISSVSHFIWLAKSNVEKFTNPTQSMLTGFMRTLQAENDDKVFVSLILQDFENSAFIVNSVTHILKRVLSGNSKDFEPEYYEIEGQICINRLVYAEPPNDHLAQNTLQRHVVTSTLLQDPPRRLALKMAAPGLLDSFQFEEILDKDLLPEDCIEVQVKAAGLNFRDVLVSLGLDVANNLGIECSGIVTRAGKDNNFNIGERVSCFVEGSISTSVRCEVHAACKIPDGMSFQIAAAFPVIFTTAYYSLIHVARLQAGESVLVHSGAGGLGQACIQLAKRLKADIFVTVGNNEKRRFLVDHYGLSEDHIFSSRNLEFASRIQRMTKGRGVDVIVNSLAGEALKATWSCIASFGRFIEVGKKDILSSGKLPMQAFSRGASFIGVDLVHVRNNAPKLFNSLMRKVIELLDKGEIKIPSPLHSFDASQIESAFRLLESGKSMGKIVVTIRDPDVVKMVLKKPPSYYFRDDASYIIAGGLGGLGQSIARWMASRGAKHLIILTLNEQNIKMNEKFLLDMESAKVNVKVAVCDVSSVDELRSALEEGKTMPPIKGCIQAAMLLKDRAFRNMTCEDFTTAVQPKVEGSWNLHSLLPSGMDFFVMLASLSGIAGIPGQANYASGNTYQDGLARSRVIHGEKALTLDLCNMSDIGYVARQKGLFEKVAKMGYMSLSEAQFHALLDYCCDPNLVLTPLNCQIVLGVQSPAQLKARNIDVPPWLYRRLFQSLRPRGNVHNTALEKEDIDDYKALLRTAETIDQVAEIIVEGLRVKLAKSLAVTKDNIEPGRPINSYGVDSLSAVELRTWFRTQISVDVSVFDILGNSSIADLAAAVAPKSQYPSLALKEGGEEK